MPTPSKLTFKEYYTWALPKLVKHPDFSSIAMRRVDAVTKMTTKELEKLNIKGVK